MYSAHGLFNNWTQAFTVLAASVPCVVIVGALSSNCSQCELTPGAIAPPPSTPTLRHAHGQSSLYRIIHHIYASCRSRRPCVWPSHWSPKRYMAKTYALSRDSLLLVHWLICISVVSCYTSYKSRYNQNLRSVSQGQLLHCPSFRYAILLHSYV